MRVTVGRWLPVICLTALASAFCSKMRRKPCYRIRRNARGCRPAFPRLINSAQPNSLMPTLPRVCVDFFYDHRAVQAVLTVFLTAGCRNDNGARRYAAIVNFTCFAIVDFGALAGYTYGNDGTLTSTMTPSTTSGTRANKAKLSSMMVGLACNGSSVRRRCLHTPER